MIILLSSGFVTEATGEIPTAVKIGDDFEFIMIQDMISEEINGIEYKNGSTPLSSGDLLKVEITAITPDYLNYTLNKNDDFSINSVTTLDFYYNYFFFGTLFLGFGQTNWPNSIDLSPMGAFFSQNESDPSTYVFPFFVTNNETEYIEKLNDPSFAPTNRTTPDYYGQRTFIIENDINQTQKIYHLRYHIDFNGETTTSSNELATIKGLLEYNTTIDYGRSVMIYFDWHIMLNVALGSDFHNYENEITFMEFPKLDLNTDLGGNNTNNPNISGALNNTSNSKPFNYNSFLSILSSIGLLTLIARKYKYTK